MKRQKGRKKEKYKNIYLTNIYEAPKNVSGKYFDWHWEYKVSPSFRGLGFFREDGHCKPTTAMTLVSAAEIYAEHKGNKSNGEIRSAQWAGISLIEKMFECVLGERGSLPPWWEV